MATPRLRGMRMLETSINYNKSILIKIDKDIIDRLDFNTPQLLIAINLMLQQAYAYHAQGQTSFKTTPEFLYENLCNAQTSNRNTRASIIQALQELHCFRLITLDTLEIQWNTKLTINAIKLLHQDNEPYLSIKSKDLMTILNHYGIKSTKPLLAYLNVTSYLDWRNMLYYYNEYVEKNQSLMQDIFYDPDLGQNWHISCYASLQTLASKPYNDSPTRKWTTEKTLSKYLHTLQELKLISIITTIKNEITMNHYCLPEYTKGVELLAYRKLDQLIYNKER